eukprot:CAMPEP_0178426278 /NCGR_PEP_ID=MMETSP0689_2-20121128/29154_1 /TAXON_ID=160604 /ORGANISM="Amphidinium massartii, Strain CS-259" /LENGTH=799 /DNA_ID=CAMNT_0020047963 /DNA_START=8 /DNA_END=2404 /DNA_ORIENTATION=+
MAAVQSGGAPTLSQEDISLDETFHMMPVSPADGSSLDALREHGSAIGSVREALTKLAASDATLADVAAWVDQATQVEAKVASVVGDSKAGETLAQGNWPTKELEQGRLLVMRSGAMQKALGSAKQQAEAPQCGPSILFDISRLLEVWSQLWKAEKQLKQQQPVSPFAAATASGVDQHRQLARPLCEQLIQKALQLKSSLASNTADADAKEQATQFSEQLGKLYHQDWVKEALRSLGVQIPAGATLAAAGGSGENAAAPQEAMFTFDNVSDCAEKAASAPPLSDSCTPPVSPSAASRAPAPSPAAAAAAPQQQQHMQQPKQAPQASPMLPPAELWQAVHVGDLATIQALMQRGACNGRMKDASGHSVLWHAVAFSHFSIAALMLDSCPPDAENGVDVEEVHPRRGDTLLHLLLAARSFDAEAATLFKRIAEAMSPAAMAKANASGHNFFHVAASTMNFWVLKFVCLSFPGPMKALLGAEPRQPLRYLADALPQLVPPSSPTQAPVPQHLALAELLSRGSSGLVPFADVALDVGPTDAPVGDPSRGRFLAHRVVLGAQSPVLLQELEKLPLEPLAKEGINAAVFHIDPRISKEVWRMVLQFLYTGVVHCRFSSEPQKMVELLRACALYKLPRSLLDFAQMTIFQLLPTCPPNVALQVFSITAGSCSKDVDVRATREASTYFLLRHAAQLFQDMDPAEVSKIMDKILQTVEEMVFSPAQAPTEAQTHNSAEHHPQQHGYAASQAAYGYGAAQASGAAGQAHPDMYMHSQEYQQHPYAAHQGSHAYAGHAAMHAGQAAPTGYW